MDEHCVGQRWQAKSPRQVETLPQSVDQATEQVENSTIKVERLTRKEFKSLISKEIGLCSNAWYVAATLVAAYYS